ncbi:MAG: hypothetical protein N3A53_00640 [Verrucomicrobiae bacterium]|nr:hypothetical protein [Verrucomicrobiae bacterium]MCX7914797.1 hypothetical protein [Verrucomicrobiae bacterium]MDW8344677.1 hypothetical protein [Verrucomicrobiae bacterium]
MKTKTLALVAVLGLTGLVIAQAHDVSRPAFDPRIDKLLEQNERILKNQEEIKQRLDKISQDLLQLRRRLS